MKSRPDELKLGKFTTLCSVLAASPAFADGTPPAAPASTEGHLAPIEIQGKTEHSTRPTFPLPRNSPRRSSTRRNPSP